MGVEECRKAIIKYRGQYLEDDAMNSKKYSADNIRKASKSFKPGTSIGVDQWSFKEIALLPDIILQDLAVIYYSVRCAVLPIQVLDNRMARIPKKQGGERTIAITATLYRRITEMDNEDTANFSAKNIYHNDSARKGQSCLTSVEKKALAAEMSAKHWLRTHFMLWDIKKFFDSVNIP